METSDPGPGSPGEHEATQDPAGAAPVDAELRTFLIADIRGYTRFTHAHGDEAAGRLAGRFAELVGREVEERGGRLLELRGDEALVVFGSARQAIRTAVALQRQFAEETQRDPSLPLAVGIGLDAGEAVPVAGGYRGGALNLAARLCARAGPGEVLASDTVVNLARRVEGVRAVKRESARLKGLAEPVRVIHLAAEDGDAGRGVRLRLPHPAVSRRAAVIALGLAAVCAVAVVGALALGGGGNGSGSRTASRAATVPVVPDSLAVVSSVTGRTTKDVRIPGGPSQVAVSRGNVWVASNASRTISQVAPGSLQIKRVVAPNATPSALASDGDAVWVLDGDRRILLKLDPSYGTVTRRIRLPPARALAASNRRLSSLNLASAGHTLWMTDGSSRLLRIDGDAGRVAKVLDLGVPLDDVAVGAGGIWAISGQSAAVYRVDSQGRAARRIVLTARPGDTSPFPVAVAVGAGAVWVLNGNTATVTKIDPTVEGVSATIPLGAGRNPSGIAAGSDAVWVALGGNGTLARIDAKSNGVRTTTLGGSPSGVDTGGGRVWVAVQPGFRAIALPKGPAEGSFAGGSESLPASFCSPVDFGGTGAPQRLIVSDFPLQGSDTVSLTLQESDAIRFILAERHYRAGRFTVGYQACDDSSAQLGNYSDRTCIRNARAYAAQGAVLGVIGPYNSGCAQVQVPILNSAPGGPLAMAAPNATAVGLTHSGPGTAPDEPKKYYPRGVRNFARIVAADDRQGIADALMARRLGIKRLYLLNDRDPYGAGIAASVRDAAKRLGIGVVGFGSWNPKAQDYAGLARRVKGARPDGVFLGGTLESNAVAVTKSLHDVLDPSVRMVAADGFTPLSVFARSAGPAAEGITVSFPAVPVNQLPPRGRAIVARFQRAIGTESDPYSIVAAQAAEVLLDAIARSDGSRRSVTDQVFASRISDGILGSFRFDANGDTTAPGVTMYKVSKGEIRVAAVIKPPATLPR